MASENKVKTKLLAGQPTLGCWNLIGHPVVAEILAQAGFDWLALDVEHGVMDWPQVVAQMQAMQGTACVPFVRIPANRPEYFKWALDGGAMGVIVPMVGTEAEARQAVTQAKYPPQGTRGVALARAQAYGADFDAYVQTANQQTLVVVMIEQAAGVE
ncbi:MAG: hypothetical protein JXB38_19445, partial [Anaerolineales bacterium]|nr:hypothetical protein [Anaerolineales bacterium]